jgi:hypothetical protein
MHIRHRTPIPSDVNPSPTPSYKLNKQLTTITQNRGREGDEIEDYAYNLTNPRRRSNSSTHALGLKDFKTKFETIEPEPVFEEELHGPGVVTATAADLDKQSTTSSGNDTQSIDEEDASHKNH